MFVQSTRFKGDGVGMLIDELNGRLYDRDSLEKWSCKQPAWRPSGGDKTGQFHDQPIELERIEACQELMIDEERSMPSFKLRSRRNVINKAGHLYQRGRNRKLKAKLYNGIGKKKRKRKEEGQYVGNNLFQNNA